MRKVLVLVAFCAIQTSGCMAFQESDSPLCETGHAKAAVNGRELSMDVECRKTDLEKGLMYRTSIPKSYGMMFCFRHPDRYAFWMKNTYVPLSVAFLNENYEIVDIKEMLPNDETPIAPAKPAQYVIEANRLWFEKAGAKIGSKIEIKALP